MTGHRAAAEEPNASHQTEKKEREEQDPIDETVSLVQIALTAEVGQRILEQLGAITGLLRERQVQTVTATPRP